MASILPRGSLPRLDPPGTTFIGDTDTPAAYGVQGQAPVVNPAGDALEFGGPFMPIPTPADPAVLRATDAFDMFLEMRWDAVSGAEAYEWQRKPSASPNWPAGNGTRTTTLSTRNTAPLTNADYDFRVRAVSIGGHLRSGWTELLNIPIIATPTPAESINNVLSRVASETLRFVWDILTVNNGGTGAARVVKNPTYHFQRRAVGTPTWGAFSGTSLSNNTTIPGLTNGVEVEMRVRGSVVRSDGTNTIVDGPWSQPSNPVRPVKNTVSVVYGVAASRTSVILLPRTVEVPINGGVTFFITDPGHPVAMGQFYALDVARGDEYDHNYVLDALETRPLATDITRGGNYVAEAEPASGPRRYSIGPADANNQTQTWYIEVA